MSEFAAHYPISILLARNRQRDEPESFEFIQALGYLNIERGRRRLDGSMDAGEGYERILNQIDGTFAVRADEIREAVAATAAVKTAESEAAFYRRCKAEDAPQRILDFPTEEQLARLPALMLAYRRRYNGVCPFFGKLTGVKFVRLLDF